MVTPRKPHGISRVMQALGRNYVRHAELTYRRTGTLWEDRYWGIASYRDGVIAWLSNDLKSPPPE